MLEYTEYLPFFEMLDLSSDELRDLGAQGMIGPYNDITMLEAVISGHRPVGYIDGREGDVVRTFSRVKMSWTNLIIMERNYRSFGHAFWIFRKDREAEAFRRIRLLVRARNNPNLLPAWEFLHGSLLGYRWEDIARYMTDPEFASICAQDLKGAYAVYDGIKQALRDELTAKAPTRYSPAPAFLMDRSRAI
jgi:hypothetical protein